MISLERPVQDPILRPVSPEEIRPPTRRLHKRNAVLLAFFLLAGFVGARTAHDVQMYRLANRLLDEAQEARQRANFREAANRLAEYLLLHPEDNESKIRQALDQAEAAGTETELYKAALAIEELLVRFPENTTLRRRAVELMLYGTRVTDALTHLEVLMQSAPDDPELQLLLGRCYEAQHAAELAIGIYRGLIEASPACIDAYERLAELLVRGRDEEGEAVTVLEAMLQANPESPQAHLAHARFFRNRGDLPRARTSALESFELNPRAIDTLCLLAELAGKVPTSESDGSADVEDRLRQSIRGEIERSPKQDRLYVALAQLSLAAGRRDDAHRVFEEGMTKALRKTELGVCLADLLLSEGRLDEASELLAQLREGNADPVLTGFIESRIAMLQGRWPAAFQILSQLRDSPRLKPDLELQIELHLARCCQALRHSAWRLAACRRALQLAPGSLEARFALADAAEDEGLLDEAAALYQSLHDAPGADWHLARVLLRQNLRLPAEERHWDELARLVESRSATSESPEWLLLKGESLLAQNELAEAEAVFADGSARFPEAADLRCGWAEVAARAGKEDQARDILEAAIAERGLTANLVLMRFRLHASRAAGTAGDALDELFRRLINRARQQPAEEQFALLEACAEGCRQVGALDRAAALWEELAAVAPYDVTVRRRQLELALEQGIDGRAAARIKELRRIEGERGIYWRLGSVLRLVGRARRGKGEPDDLKEARALLREVALELPHVRALALIEGQIAEIQGDPARAVEHYRDALEGGIRTPELLDKTARLLLQLQRFTEAEQLLFRFTPSLAESSPSELSRLSAEAAFRSGNLDAAVARAELAVNGGAGAVDDYLWLGTLLEAAGRKAEAEAAFRQACERAPAEPAAGLALVGWLARHDRASDANTALESLVVSLPEPRATLTRAQGNAILGRSEEATALFAAALELAPDDARVALAAAEFFMQRGDMARAQPLWERVCDSDDPSCQKHLPLARRALAACLAGRGTHAQRLKALQELQRNAEQGAESSADLKLKARILALEPDRPRWKKAVSLLTRLGENAALSEDDQFLLARLQVSLGDWPAARAELHNLSVARPRDADVFAFGARHMLEHESDDLDLAEKWVERLAELEPASFRTLALRARLAVAQERCDEARRLLREGCAAAAGQAEQSAQNWWRDSGLLLDELAGELEGRGNDHAGEFYEQAEEHLRTALVRAPERAPDLVQFLARRGRRNEAISLAERQAGDCLPAELAVALVNVLQIGQPGPEEFRRVRALLHGRVIKSAPADAQVLFSLGNLAQVERQYPEAERFYRRTLELEPEHVLAANNLAYLMALRRGNLEEAEALIKRVLDQTGPVPSLLDTRAVIWSALGRPQDAISDLEAALAERRTPAREFHLCQALLLANRRGAARSSYQRIVASGIGKAQLHPLEAKAWDSLERELKTE